MRQCLLWIVYRAVVIELSEPGPSPICALLRVWASVIFQLEETSESHESFMGYISDYLSSSWQVTVILHIYYISDIHMTI